MNELEIKRVPLMGTELIAARDEDGQIWAGVRWMCEGIGLSKSQSKSQVEKINEDKVLSKGVGNFRLPTAGGMQDAYSLKLEFVPLWLAKINITPAMEQETPELAARLMEYQLKAKDVLAAAFLPATAVPNVDALSPELRVLINLELQQKEQARVLEEVNQKVDNIRDVVALSPNSWRADAHSLISRIAHSMGGIEHIRDVHAELYRLVDERAGVSLATRLTNKRRRMADEGVCKSKRDKLTKMDVIADDRKLIEIYLAVVKDMAVRSGVSLSDTDGERRETTA